MIPAGTRTWGHCSHVTHQLQGLLSFPWGSMRVRTTEPRMFQSQSPAGWDGEVPTLGSPFLTKVHGCVYDGPTALPGSKHSAPSRG